MTYNELNFLLKNINAQQELKHVITSPADLQDLRPSIRRGDIEDSDCRIYEMLQKSLSRNEMIVDKAIAELAEKVNADKLTLFCRFYYNPADSNDIDEDLIRECLHKLTSEKDSLEYDNNTYQKFVSRAKKYRGLFRQRHFISLEIQQASHRASGIKCVKYNNNGGHSYPDQEYAEQVKLSNYEALSDLRKQLDDTNAEIAYIENVIDHISPCIQPWMILLLIGGVKPAVITQIADLKRSSFDEKTRRYVYRAIKEVETS